MRCVKYLYKYVTKGPDHMEFITRPDNAALQQPINEIKRYQECRYISPPEAAWRTFRFPHV